MSILTNIIASLSPITSGGLPHPSADTNSIQIVLEIVFNIIGGLALLIVVVSGLRYITSTGDPQKTSRAKDGVVYALIGLAVAVTAQAIVVFVGKRL